MNTNQHKPDMKSDLEAMRSGLAGMFEVLRRLRKEDIDDIAELLVEIKDAEFAKDRERLESAVRALLEVVAPHDNRFSGVAPLRSGQKSAGLDRWKKYVAKQVAELRASRGMTQVQLAEESGLPQSHISRIERAALSPSRKTVERLAKALGVPLSRLDPSSN